MRMSGREDGAADIGPDYMPLNETFLSPASPLLRVYPSTSYRSFPSAYLGVRYISLEDV